MANIDKTFDFSKDDENLYNIDSYKVHSTVKSMEIDFSGNVKLKNFSTAINTDNFYGDGRLGYNRKMQSDTIRPSSFYFEKFEDHAIFGPCLYNVWFTNGGNVSQGDEFVLYKKHIEKEEYINELGQWEVVTIKEKIIEGSKTHYALVSSPLIDFSLRTTNSATFILQYTTLEMYDNIFLKQEIDSKTYTSYPLWKSRAVSAPDGILFIKANEEIIIGRNSYIACHYGNNGTAIYSNATFYSTGGAPLGGGIDSVYSTSMYNPTIIDTRSAGSFDANTPTQTKVFTPGGMGHYGLNHESRSTWGRKAPLSDNLNDNIYTGIGGNQAQFVNSYFYGASGGGIVIIQTPKITFMNKESKIISYGSSYGSSYETLEQLHGGGGSILLKAESIILLENPNLSSLQEEDFPTTEAINGAIVENGVTIPAVPNNYNFCNLTTMKVLPTTIANRSAIQGQCFSAPGQIQIETDKLIIEGVEIVDIIEDNLKDFIRDYRTCNIVSNIRNIGGTINPWSYTNNALLENHSFSTPKYEINSWFKFYTEGLKNINIENWYDVVKFTSTSKILNKTEIKLAFSIDKSLTWQYINLNGENPTVDSININTEFDVKGNTPQELNDFLDQTTMTKMFILPQRANAYKSIDICIAMKTTTDYLTPLFDSMYISYNQSPSLEAPIPINPYNGEEFNNEYVDFIWLQPSQKYGSIQNRIEINTIANFDKDEHTLSAEETTTSSANGRVIIPYKPSKYNNTVNTLHSFKLPYIKNRALGIINAYDYVRHSVVFDVTNRKFKYNGGDDYFVSGQTITTKPQVDLAFPENMDCRINVSTCPKAGSLVSLIDFTNITNYNTLLDKKGPQLWSSVEVGSSINATTNIVYNNVPKFYVHKNSYIKFNMNGSLLPTQSFLRKNNEKTIYVRFNINSLTRDTPAYIFSAYNKSWSTFWGFVYLYKTVNQFNESIIQVYYSDSHNHYLTYKSVLSEHTENVIVLQYEASNKANLFVNGIKTIINMSSHYHDTENTSYYSSTSKFELVFGKYATDTESSTSFSGSIIEFGIWEDNLTDEEIIQISKIPTYSLRYNIVSDKLEWQQHPYFNHLSDYQFVQDKVSDYDAYDYNRWDVNYTSFANNGGRCYYNNSKSLLMGIFSPNERVQDSFIEHTQEHKSINGIPFLQNRGSRDNTANRQHMVYLDNNSIRHNYLTNGVQLLLDHKRINSNTDSFEVNFFTRSSTILMPWQDIGLISGAFSLTEVSPISYFSRFAYIRKYKNNTYKYSVQIRHTNNSISTVVDLANLPHNLLSDTMYSLKWEVTNDIYSSTLSLYSDFDENYKAGVILWNKEKTNNNHIASAYGFGSRNFNDVSHVFGLPYEEVGIVMDIGENPAFEIINLSTSDVQSIIEQKAGFVPRYDLISYVTNDYLKKINFCDIKGDSDNALTDIRFFASFDSGVTWRVFEKSSYSWVIKNVNNYENGMSANDLMSLTTYNYEAKDGFVIGKSFTLRSVLITKDSRSTPYLDYIKVSYNGPMIIDSWDADGSFYDGTEFFYTNTGGWNPYLEPNFADENQGWLSMGSGIPDELNFVENHGSKPSESTKKCFAGVRVLLNPKGKYYWRIAAYNGK